MEHILSGDAHWSGDYSGAGGPKTPAGYYFYLVVRSDERERSLDPDDIQKFFRTGVNAGRDYAFTMVDIMTDHRLGEDVLKMENGPAFYEKLDASTPAFLITRFPLHRLKDADDITLHPVTDYEKDVNIIYKEMGLPPVDTRRRTINFLRKVNSYLNLKPSIFGFGANLNEVIADLIKRLERDMP
jgi:hypothetical protein